MPVEDFKNNNVFTMEALLLAMAPVDVVLDAFIREVQEEDEDDKSIRTCDTPSHDAIKSTEKEIESKRQRLEAWTSPESQQRFALTLASHWNENGPSGRYLRKLIRRYVARMEGLPNNVPIENDELVALLMKCSFCKDDAFPDPDECGYASYQIQHDIVRIRIYPQHNNVGISRVWEAGACLAEFLLANPQYVANKRVVELGAGVGLTGLIAAGACGAQHVHMTDYTSVVLENMQHNVDINAAWLQRQSIEQNDDVVTTGFLKFGSVSTDPDLMENGTASNKTRYLWNADVVLAADVAYDIKEIPALVTTVCGFIFKETSSSRPCAIFATTYRNKVTFDALERELVDSGCLCQHVDPQEIDALPRVFPCYFVQPRTDVRICIVTAVNRD